MEFCKIFTLFAYLLTRQDVNLTIREKKSLFLYFAILFAVSQDHIQVTFLPL